MTVWTWITANIGTIVVGAALAVVLFFVIRSMVKKTKKNGFCSCGCDNCSGNCAHCAAASSNKNKQ